MLTKFLSTLFFVILQSYSTNVCLKRQEIIYHAVIILASALFNFFHIPIRVMSIAEANVRYEAAFGFAKENIEK
jgi:hypothetical protein